jgi:uncharacterized protein YndB with AHSA1/START domain
MDNVSEAQAGEPIRHTLVVLAPVERAFAAFTAGLASWWPREYTWAGDVLETIAIEPREGGRCFERGPESFTCDWGRVRAWEPPRRLVFTWQISPRREPEPNPARASEAEVRFVREGPASTRVEFEHRHLERHGQGGDTYRDALASTQGWPYILGRYAAALNALNGELV